MAVFAGSGETAALLLADLQFCGRQYRRHSGMLPASNVPFHPSRTRGPFFGRSTAHVHIVLIVLCNTIGRGGRN
jgi:hypothetical protein